MRTKVQAIYSKADRISFLHLVPLPQVKPGLELLEVMSPQAEDIPPNNTHSSFYDLYTFNEHNQLLSLIFPEQQDGFTIGR